MTTLIFDCDGVLADTERDGHLVAFNLAFEEFGLSTRWSVQDYRALLSIGGGKERLRSLLTAQVRDTGLPADPDNDDEFIARLHRRKTEIFIDLVESGRLPARSGVSRVIADALAAGWSVAVASTSAEPSVRAVLRAAAGTATDKVRVFAGDVVPNKKPAPDIYLLAVEELGADPADTVVVEDSEVGAAAAAAAGLHHLITVSTFTVDERFPAASAVVTQLGDAGQHDVGTVLIDRLKAGEISCPVTLEQLLLVATTEPRT
jgi:HAD superfamily hydrolase (TIGR01509 family)